MKHIFFPLLFIFVLSRHTAHSQQPVKDKLHASKQIKMAGYLNDRLQSSYAHNILDQDIDHLIAPFKKRTETRMWKSEFWGKWFTSAILAYRYQPGLALRAKLDYAVKELIATQSIDGYIGNYAQENRLQQWDIWGRKYCMLGLLDYYDLTGDGKSLKAAKGVADNLMADLGKAGGIIVTKGNYRGMAASSVLEPICLLYTRTKEKKYLNFAEEIVRQWETSDGPGLISKSNIDVASRFPKPEKNWYSWEQGQKAYEMMSCYEGLLELYRLTGKSEYKEAVEKTWENIRNKEINLAGSGASVEMWFGGAALQTDPVYHYQETCVTVTWIKLCQQLLRLTGEAKYADAVEQAYYNALLGSLSLDGLHWAKYTPLVGERLPGSGQCGMDLNCCEASGPRGLFNLPSHILMRSADGAKLNYFVPGTYASLTPSGKKFDMAVETNYPKNGLLQLKVGVQKQEQFVIHIRIPAWSLKNEVRVNGELINVNQIGSYLAIDRKWQPGDQIQVELDMRGRVIKMGEKLQYTAIMRGPILLARDSRVGGPDLLTTVAPLADKSGYIVLEEVANKNTELWMQFKATFIPEGYKEENPVPVKIDLCDYASAGNGTVHSIYKVWMPQLYNPRGQEK